MANASIVNGNNDNVYEFPSKNRSKERASSCGSGRKTRKPKRKTKVEQKISQRQLAGIRLKDLYRCAEVLRAHREILDPGPWLKVLAATLSSAPPKVTKTKLSPPDQLALNVHNLGVEMGRCGFVVGNDGLTLPDIARQVAGTQAWRDHESRRSGARHYAPMKPDVIGELLGITDAIRQEAKAWSLGTIGGSVEARREAAKERDRIAHEVKRRADRVVPREVYEERSFSRQKPWEAEGVSRATWYRRKQRADIEAMKAA